MHIYSWELIYSCNLSWEHLLHESLQRQQWIADTANNNRNVSLMGNAAVLINNSRKCVLVQTSPCTAEQQRPCVNEAGDRIITATLVCVKIARNIFTYHSRGTEDFGVTLCDWICLTQAPAVYGNQKGCLKSCCVFWAAREQVRGPNNNAEQN